MREAMQCQIPVMVDYMVVHVISGKEDSLLEQWTRARNPLQRS